MAFSCSVLILVSFLKKSRRLTCIGTGSQPLLRLRKHMSKNVVTGDNKSQDAELKTLNSVCPIIMCENYLLNLMNNVCSVLSPVSFEQECCVICFSCCQYMYM